MGGCDIGYSYKDTRLLYCGAHERLGIRLPTYLPPPPSLSFRSFSLSRDIPPPTQVCLCTEASFSTDDRPTDSYTRVACPSIRRLATGENERHLYFELAPTVGPTPRRVVSIPRSSHTRRSPDLRLRTEYRRAIAIAVVGTLSLKERKRDGGAPGADSDAWSCTGRTVRVPDRDRDFDLDFDFVGFLRYLIDFSDISPPPAIAPAPFSALLISSSTAFATATANTRATATVGRDVHRRGQHAHRRPVVRANTSPVHERPRLRPQPRLRPHPRL